MNSDCVDLIATDPPFNKNKDFHATSHSLAQGASFQDRWTWEDDVHPDWVDQIKDDHPRLMEAIEAAKHAHSDGMGAFMCFLSVRLLTMRRILKDTGSIYLHCDPTASHYIKACMDAIFGAKNFRNEIIWKYGLGGSSKKFFSRKHDIILFYSKGVDYYFDKPEEKATSNAMKGQMKGMTDVWAIPSINNLSAERTGYPTQKPLALYRRIIAASSNKGDIVMDPFCGCATTLVAAEHLDRRWVGIDLWKRAAKIVEKRLEQESIGGDGIALSRPKINYTEELPERTDEGDDVIPALKATWRTGKSPQMRREKMIEWLARNLKEVCGGKLMCPGCGTSFHSVRYFHLDHVEPRSNGGRNTIGNRILLCGPCNGIKSNSKTMSELIKHNKKENFFPPHVKDRQKHADDLNKLLLTMREKAEAQERKEIAKWAKGGYSRKQVTLF